MFLKQMFLYIKLVWNTCAKLHQSVIPNELPLLLNSSHQSITEIIINDHVSMYPSP